MTREPERRELARLPAAMASKANCQTVPRSSLQLRMEVQHRDRRTSAKPQPPSLQTVAARTRLRAMDCSRSAQEGKSTVTVKPSTTFGMAQSKCRGDGRLQARGNCYLTLKRWFRALGRRTLRRLVHLMREPTPDNGANASRSSSSQGRLLHRARAEPRSTSS